MKTQINGVEITPKMAEVFKEWFDYRNAVDTYPVMYVEWMCDIQDLLTRFWINRDDVADSDVKKCMDRIFRLKADFKKLIPEWETPTE